jgi:predicted glycosyl hydrolase (DUF1957 family)
MILNINAGLLPQERALNHSPQRGMLLETTGYVKVVKICELAWMEKHMDKTNSNTEIHHSFVDEHSFLYHRSYIFRPSLKPRSSRKKAC